MPSLSTPNFKKNRHLRSNSAEAANAVDRELFTDRLKQVVSMFGSNSALSREIGSAESTIRRWINGSVEPKYESLVAIASAANVSFEWLMTGNGAMTVETSMPISNAEPVASNADLRDRTIATVHWDNMEPTLHQGDEVGIEFVQITPCEVTTGIYMLKMGNTEGIWRLQPTVDKKLWLLNDNPKYQRSDTLIDLGKAHDIEIGARIIWVRHKL